MRKPAKLTKRWLLLMGALLGSASATFMSAVVLVGLIFPLSFSVTVTVLGASFGAIVTIISDKHEASRWIALAAAAFVGLLIPICLIQMLFLLMPPN